MSFHHVKDLPAAKVLKTGQENEPVSTSSDHNYFAKIYALVQKRIAIKAPTAFPSTDQLTAEEQIPPESVFTIGSVSTLTPAVVADVSPPTSERSNEDAAGDTEETFVTSAELLANKISTKGE